ncbi:MAG: hypothetical protein ACUVWN_12095 [bacterium]
MPKVYTEEEISKLSFVEKQKLAREEGFDIYMKTEEQIDALLTGKTKTGGIRYSRKEAMGISDEVYKELLKNNEQLPKDTFIPAEDYDDWMAIIAKNPIAFNGIDLTNVEGEIVHILSKNKRKVHCVCGAKFSIPDRDSRNNPITIYPCPGVPVVYTDLNGKPRKKQQCLPDGGFRRYIIHEVPK